ncbi:MAG: leucine-rich repeat domain-containing protein [Oscillospiraceae bacterium]|nr:leucine-rich repeat domain-containing protein [Oscillospiraceae bacterium]
MRKEITLLLLGALVLMVIGVLSGCTDVAQTNSSEYSSSSISANTSSSTKPTPTFDNPDSVEDLCPPVPDSSPLESIGLEYEKNKNNPYYMVTGIGTCTDTTVYIPAEYKGLPVKAISKKAFQFCTSFNEIVLPDSIESIGAQAFKRCSELKKITLSDNLKTIGFEAFMFSGITSISIPDEVEGIGISAFGYCSSLTNITFTSTKIKTIPETCFSGCGSLQTITVPNGVASIEKEAFYGCTALSSITLPESLDRIDLWCFEYCTSLNEITIPKNVSDVNYCAFVGCNDIDIYCYADIDLPNFVDVTATIHYCN